MRNGHCRDKDGGAWSYRTESGECVHTERNIPRDVKAVKVLPHIFPDVQHGGAVLDFGGGPGAYLVSFRDAMKSNVSRLVTMEPHPFGDCLFRGIVQDQTNLINTPLRDLRHQEYDLVQTIEVLEHIPVDYHKHVIDALTQATKQWLLFSAAHPGQPGEGHVGPSMKTREEWIHEITASGTMEVDDEKTKMLHKSCGALLQQNAVIFRRRRLQ